MAVLAKINLWKCQVYKIHDFCSGKFNFDGITSISANKRFTLGVHAESWVPRGQCTPAGFETQQEFILEHSMRWLCKLAHVRRSTVDSRKNRWIINSYRYRWLFEIKTFTSKSRSLQYALFEVRLSCLKDVCIDEFSLQVMMLVLR